MILCQSVDERLGASWSEVEAVLNGKCPWQSAHERSAAQHGAGKCRSSSAGVLPVQVRAVDGSMSP